jgi:NTP pyrophosphatase (non-canonical NTP hydrolase)
LLDESGTIYSFATINAEEELKTRMRTPRQSDQTFDEIAQIIWQYLVEREWQNNPSRGLATSIALEAGELLEHYQWHDEPVGDKEELAAELADIFIYAFQFAMTNDIDIAGAMKLKLDKAAKKYPAKSFQGKSAEERSAAWIDAKLHYKKEGL